MCVCHWERMGRAMERMSGNILSVISRTSSIPASSRLRFTQYYTVDNKKDSRLFSWLKKCIGYNSRRLRYSVHFLLKMKSKLKHLKKFIELRQAATLYRIESDELFTRRSSDVVSMKKFTLIIISLNFVLSVVLKFYYYFISFLLTSR